MGIQFEIQYENNPYGMFFTGQVVRGRAFIKLDEAVSARGVRLTVRGYAKVKWEESTSVTNSDGTSNTVYDTHSDKIDYFDTTIECIDTKESELKLEPGVHTYSFECPLPADCPSSFKGLYGRVQYETIITLVRTWKFNKSYSKAFNVHKTVDLNQSPILRIPSSMEIIKTFCCGPCKSKPFILILQIPQTGYAPGEFIRFRAKCVNNSSTKIEQLRIALYLIVFYKVRSRVSTKTQKIRIAEIEPNVSEEKMFEIKDRLQVPPTPPTCENLCEILKISYELEIKAKVSGAHKSPFITIPVTIGNIPIIATPAEIAENNLIANLRNGIMPGQQSMSGSDLPPPSYEEAAYMQQYKGDAPEKGDENMQFETYLPRYPFYGEQFPNSAMQNQQ